MKELSETYLPATLKKLEETIMKNGSEKGWIVGQKVSEYSHADMKYIHFIHCKSFLSYIPCLQVTYADLAIAVLLDALSKYKPEILVVFSSLTKLKKSVEELPNIEKWIANRPDTSH